MSKTVGVNIAFIGTFFKEYSISFLMVCRLIDFAFVILELLMFKVCGIIGISKINFPVLKGLKGFLEDFCKENMTP